MSRPELVEDRFEELVRELRSGRVAAPPELRGRVRAIAASAPEPRPSIFERVRLRRAALVLVPVGLAAVVSAAMVQGLVSSGQRDVATYGVVLGPTGGAYDRGQRGRLSPVPLPKTPATQPEADAAPLPPGSRLVDYRIRMRLRVRNLEDLSRATVRTMRTVRRLGGYVGSVRYSSPNVRHGDAVIAVRVPVIRMQAAILAFSELGTIVSQSVSLTDVQKTYNRQVERIGKLRTLIARGERRLRDEELTAEERTRLQERLSYQRADLVALTQQKEATGERGRMATATISLTTFSPAAKQAVPNEPSRFGRAFEDSGDILTKQLVWAVYGLIVAAPLLVLAVLLLGAGRARRRRSERQLLARAG